MVISYVSAGYVQGILQDFIVVTVTESNILGTNEPHYFPATEEIIDLLDIGDMIKVCFLCEQKRIEEDRDEVRFTPNVVKFERWNEDNAGWDLLGLVVPQVPAT